MKTQKFIRGCPPTDQPGDGAAQQKREKDGDPAQAWQRPIVQMPIQVRKSYPATDRCQIAYEPGQENEASTEVANIPR